MSKARSIIDTQIKSLIENKRKMQNESTKYDREISAFYHDLEGKKFNAAEGYFIAKELQRLLRCRRKMKYEESQLAHLINQLEDAKEVLRNKEKQYFKNNTAYHEYIN